jgi:hypothetical protein
MDKSGRKKIKLEDIGKKDIYQVPEGFFMQLPNLIQQKIAGARPTGFNGYFTLPRLTFAGIGLITCCLGIWFAFFQSETPGKLPLEVQLTNEGSKPPAGTGESEKESAFTTIHPYDSGPASKTGNLTIASSPGIDSQDTNEPDRLLAGIDISDITWYLRTMEESDDEDINEEL